MKQVEKEQIKPNLMSLAEAIDIIRNECKNNTIKQYAKTEFDEKIKPYEKDTKIIKDIVKCKDKISDCGINYIFLIGHIIDACYSTQVKRFNDIYKICEIISEKDSKIKDFIKSDDPENIKKFISEIVNKIKETKDLNKKPFFSFVTKYFALHGKRNNANLAALPIYDRYVQMYMNAFVFCNKLKITDSDFNQDDVDYKKFYDAMEQILENEDRKRVEDFDQLDNKIWFTAKCLQFRIAKENLSKDDLKVLLDKLGLNLKKSGDNKDKIEDKFVEYVIRDIKNSYKD